MLYKKDVSMIKINLNPRSLFWKNPSTAFRISIIVWLQLSNTLLIAKNRIKNSKTIEKSTLIMIILSVFETLSPDQYISSPRVNIFKFKFIPLKLTVNVLVPNYNIFEVSISLMTKSYPACSSRESGSQLALYW